jgi:iron(III) transport system ATP-binding protein
MPTLLKVTAITCRYEQRQVCNNLSFSVARGDIVSLLGPSGCGKTTVLRAIAGFEPIYAGNITLAERVLSQEGQSVPPEQRQVGMVFQDYALFPHLTVAANIGFGLHGLNAVERAQVVSDMLALTRLTEYADAWPHNLSGGQQQRVALARALAPQPKLLLLDEPFSNLDTELRRSLCLEVRDVLKARGTTAILVTHDQSEAFSMADEVGVMAEGRILQWDTPETLYLNPASAQVARFLGQGQFVPAALKNGTLITPLGPVMNVELTAEQPLPPALALVHAAAQTAKPGAVTSVELLLRPSQLKFQSDSPHKALIVSRNFQGAVTLSTLQLADGQQVQSDDPAFAKFPLQTQVGVVLNPVELRYFL